MARRLALGVALTLLAWFAGHGWANAAEPLTITIDAPPICETEPEIHLSPDIVQVGWDVRGGQGPYQVLINGDIYEDSSGVIDVPCGHHSLSGVASGPITIQATVTDALGRKASTLADMYAMRVISTTPRSQIWLRAGETHRVHQLLLTMPLDQGFYMSRYATGDCTTWDESCDDRFMLWEASPTASFWVRRWSGTEYGRVMGGEFYAPGEAEQQNLRYELVKLGESFDQVLSMVGQLPRTYRVTQPVGPEDGRMRLNLYAPAYCQIGNAGAVDVSWEVSGGRGPYEVTVDGQRYLGQRGRVQVQCGLGWTTNFRSRGHQRLQGTVVDANGATASARADMYALGWVWGGSEHLQGVAKPLPPEQPLRVGDTVMTLPADFGEAVRWAEGGLAADSLCVREQDGRQHCEDISRLTLTDGEQTASFAVGHWSGRVFERSPRTEVSQALNEMIDRLLASIGKPPPLPDDFVESSAPLTITGFVNPSVCEYSRYGGSANLYWTATGGRWWPLEVTLNGAFQSRNPAYINCRELGESGEIVLRVRESGSEPAEAELRLKLIAQESDQHEDRSWALRLRLPQPAVCDAGQPIALRDVSEYEDLDGLRLEAHDGVNQWRGTSSIDCAELPGWFRVTTRLPARDDPSQEQIHSYILRAVQPRPERSSE